MKSNKHVLDVKNNGKRLKKEEEKFDWSFKKGKECLKEKNG